MLACGVVPDSSGLEGFGNDLSNCLTGAFMSNKLAFEIVSQRQGQA